MICRSLQWLTALVSASNRTGVMETDCLLAWVVSSLDDPMGGGFVTESNVDLLNRIDCND